MNCLKYAVILQAIIVCQNVYAQSQNQAKVAFMQSRIDSVAVGKPIPDFTMLNENLKEIKFSSFLGKTVVIDIWATWCKPCIQLSPWFEKESEKFKEENVVFMSISVDEQQGRWVNYIQSYEASYNRYWIEDDKKNPIKWLTFAEFEISPGRTVWGESIPKFIIVNKEGIVEALNFGQPGVPPFRRAVKKALKE